MTEAISYSFRVDTNFLVVTYLTADSRSPYEHDIAQIPLLDKVMREDGERGRSQIILHLSEKMWVTIPMLYDIAEQINHFRPSNKIDWVATFLSVELHNKAARLTDENYVPVHTDPEELAKGELSASDFLGEALMTEQYLQGFDAQTIQQVKQRVLDELKKRSIA